MPSAARAEAPVLMERDGWERDAVAPVSRHTGGARLGGGGDQLPHRLPAADRVLPSGTRHPSGGLPLISHIGAGIGQSHHPEVLKNSKIKIPL